MLTRRTQGYEPNFVIFTPSLLADLLGAGLSFVKEAKTFLQGVVDTLHEARRLGSIEMREQARGWTNLGILDDSPIWAHNWQEEEQDLNQVQQGQQPKRATQRRTKAVSTSMSMQGLC